MSLSDMKESMHFWHSTGGPLLYAHRGASRECPENTLPAFERALELGADVIELDVHPTRDGVFVVSHDATAARVAGVARALCDASWAEVSGWDAGAGFVDERGVRPFAGSGVRFARFDEVLARFRDVAVNVDVKDARPRDLEQLLSIVREAKAESRVLLTSFSYRVLSRLRTLGYTGAIGLSQLDVVRLVFSPGLFDRLFPLRRRARADPDALGADRPDGAACVHQVQAARDRSGLLGRERAPNGRVAARARRRRHHHRRPARHRRGVSQLTAHRGLASAAPF
jgi:glycerophosphoryl diester phosphodiesterase